MNCTEAKVLLAAHRDLKNEAVDTTELDLHLEQCSSCREVLAEYGLIGKQMHALPVLEPAPDMHAKLMRALAIEHAQFIKNAPFPVQPPPEFLKPYLQQHAQSAQASDSLAAFSTADTGPLPMLSRVHKKQRRPYVSHFAIIGLAAVLLMAIMTGGITSLLLLAHNTNTVSITDHSASVTQFTNVAKASYTTITPYQHVVNAVADENFIYYSAYSDVASDGWMLEKLDRLTNLSTPLLQKPGTNPLIIMGSSNNWLVWLEYDAPKLLPQNTTINHIPHSVLRPWSLHALSLTPRSVSRDDVAQNQPITLLSGLFDQDSVVSWIHSPVQDTAFVQNTLLVTMVDQSGVSHLLQYTLDAQKPFSQVEIARADPNHIFTSPTANSDGSQVFWSDEWLTNDDNLHSNIWTQQDVAGPHPLHGRAVQSTTTIKEQFTNDGMSFSPSVVDDSLFMLSTADPTVLSAATPGTTPAATATSTPLSGSVTATPNTNTPATVSWANNSIYPASVDAGIRGTVLMYPLEGINTLQSAPTELSTFGSASALQTGRDFVLWQSSDGNNNYAMFDVLTKTPITVGDVLNDAQFIAVNGSTTVWTTATSANAPSTSGSTMTLQAFNWPRK